MRKQCRGRALVVLLMALAMATTGAEALQPEYYDIVDQSEFATGVYAAIVNVVRSSVDPQHALFVLQKEGLVDSAWDGSGDVTTGEAVTVFDRMGIQLALDVDDETPLTSAVFERILRDHRGEIRRNKQHWDVVTKFSRGLTLGEYRERVISGSGF